MSNSMKSLCIVLLLLACGRLSAQNQEHRVRNAVLVQGAWADGSGWKGVYDILVKDATTSASFKSQRRPLRMMWLPPSASLLNKMDLVFLSLTATEEP